MTNTELVRKKLTFLLTCVNELRTLADPEKIASDVREERFVVHTLQLAIQSALDVAFHLLSDEGWGEPHSNREGFAILARKGVLEAPLADTLARMVGFRNVIVHGYEVVDLAIVRDVVEHRLGDLEAFAAVVDRWLETGRAR